MSKLGENVELICREHRWVIKVIAFVGMLSSSLSAWGQYGLSPGPYHVLTSGNIALHDESRNKDLPLKIYYPDGAGPFPVIIFSHGALASKDCYSELGRFWASFGYVSIHPSHDDSVIDSGFRGSLRDAISAPQKWENRPRDISFIIDSLSQIERLVPQLKGELDRQRIGVGGHSFGAYTAELVGGTTITLPSEDTPKSFRDNRVKAILVLSPQGEGRMGLTSRSWDNLHLPMLLMYGSLDFGAWGQAPAWRSEAYQMAPPGNKYKVELAGGRHMGFAASSQQSGVQNEVFQCTKLETLAFWDAYLKKDPKARQYLDSDGLKKFSLDFAKFETK